MSARLPTIYNGKEYLESGGLMSYGPNYPICFAARPISLTRFCVGQSRTTSRSSKRPPQVATSLARPRLALFGRDAKSELSPECVSKRKSATQRARASEFVEPDQCDLGRPVLFGKIFWFSPAPNHFITLAVSSHQRGGSRSSRTRGGMRWTRIAPLTNGAERGRRSRVVLTPRRWRQVGGSFSTGDGDNKPDHRGEQLC